MISNTSGNSMGAQFVEHARYVFRYVCIPTPFCKDIEFKRGKSYEKYKDFVKTQTLPSLRT